MSFRTRISEAGDNSEGSRLDAEAELRIHGEDRAVCGHFPTQAIEMAEKQQPQAGLDVVGPKGKTYRAVVTNL